ncbi:MAG: tetratricopeptide repeat protein [Fimbriimonadaceae bacterium]|nr:tetratricopeptide repeat protein [Fimbriimonadaceae bacterium]
MTPEEQAQSHYARGEYQLAADLFGQALQDSPNSAALLRDHGLALALAGRPEDALTSAGKAAQLQPANPDIRYAHGYVLALAGRHAEAIEELDRALILKTTHTAAREALLGALTAQAHAVADTDPGTAEAALHRAMKLDSRNPKRAADYLEFLSRTNQKGKLQREAEQIDASIQHLEPLKSTLEKLLGAHAVAPLSSSNRFVPTAQPGPTQPAPPNPAPPNLAPPKPVRPKP